jgi:hypothetical protein
MFKEFFRKRSKMKAQEDYVAGYEWACGEILVKGTSIFDVDCQIRCSIDFGDESDLGDFDNGAHAASVRLYNLLCVNGLTEFDQHNGTYIYLNNQK